MATSSGRTFRVIGPGRAGQSMSRALARRGWRHVGTLGRHDDPTAAAVGVDVLILAVPDGAIADVARAVTPGDAVVLHLAGSRPLDDLRPHRRRGSLHPLISLPDPDTGARRLLGDCWFALSGDPMTTEVATALGGRVFSLAEADRALYHATAAVAANHLTALCAQIERLAGQAGVPIDAYWQLMTTTLANIVETGAAAALTGPAARGDWGTIAAHLAALDPDEQALYLCLSRAAAQLADRPWPPALGPPP